MRETQPDFWSLKLYSLLITFPCMSSYREREGGESGAPREEWRETRSIIRNLLPAPSAFRPLDVKALYGEQKPLGDIRVGVSKMFPALTF